MTELIYFGRVVLSAVLGMMIGYERKNRAKEAGLRTHAIVACAAALMMIISKYGFFDLAIDALGTRSADPARIAAQVVSGVGFLGAGMIFVQRQTIKGLTTAAGMWATAGIGLAIGAGMYVIGILTAVLVVVIQIVLHANMKLLLPPHAKAIKIKGVPRGYRKELGKMLSERGISMEELDVSHNRENDTYDLSFTAEFPPKTDEEEILALIPYDAEMRSVR